MPPDLPPPTPSRVAAQLDLLQQGVDEGWLRPLDRALALHLVDLSQALAAGGPSAMPPTEASPEPPSLPTVMVLAALVAHLEGRGHTCLPLDELAQAPLTLLGWPDSAQALWHALLPPEQAPQAHGLACWMDALDHSPLVSRAPAMGGEPLVRVGHRLYLRRHWHHEQVVARHVLQRAAHRPRLDEARATEELAALFPPAPTSGTPSMNWQQAACAIALRAGLSIVTGGPGTGKTYTVARLLDLLYRLAPSGQKPRVMLAAPTGKAAARLSHSIDHALSDLSPGLKAWLPPQACTLHALLGVQRGTRQFRHGPDRPLPLDVLIVDEASMVHLEMMSCLLEALPAQARLILLGDRDQLSSVEAGAVLGDLCRRATEGLYDADTCAWLHRLTGQTVPEAFHLAQASAHRPVGAGTALLAAQTVMLRESRRFQGPIGELAQAVNAGQGAQAWSCLQGPAPDRAGREVAWRPCVTPDAVAELALHGRDGVAAPGRLYLDELARRPPSTAPLADFEAWACRVLREFDRFRVLCATREGPWGVQGLNDLLAQAYARQGLLRRTGEWYEGRPVMVTRNDAALGVYNGDVGVTLPWPSALGGPPTLKVFFLDGDTLRSVQASRLSEVETAFAMTVHKSQGSEFEHTVLVLPDRARELLTRELVYTGITRARQAVTLVGSHGSVFDAALARQTRRHSGLAASFDAMLAPAVSLPLSPPQEP